MFIPLHYFDLLMHRKVDFSLYKGRELPQREIHSPPSVQVVLMCGAVDCFLLTWELRGDTKYIQMCPA